MTLRVLVNGAFGKMGSIACQTLREHPDFEVIAGLGRQDDLKQAIAANNPDLVLELTRADCVYRNSLTIIEAGIRPVVGASGLNAEQIQHLKNRCEDQRLGGLIVPNFSIAALLMMRFAAQAAQHLQDVAIIEAHHPQKIDSPSGTALKTAALIAEHQQKDPADIIIHSMRLPGVLARQEVFFGSPGETLSIVHNSLDRSCFMPGLILACQRVVSLNRLYYGLETFF